MVKKPLEKVGSRFGVVECCCLCRYQDDNRSPASNASSSTGIFSLESRRCGGADETEHIRQLWFVA